MSFALTQFYPECPFMMNLSISADLQRRADLELRGETLSLQDQKSAHERRREFFRALENTWNIQEKGKKPLKTLLNRIFLLPDYAQNQSVFSAVIQAFFKREGYFHRLFSGESWEEWTENRTALGRVISHFRDCVQSPTLIENNLLLDELVMQKANEEAEGLLEKIERSTSTQGFKNSCISEVMGGVVITLVTQSPFPFFFGLSGCLSSVSAQQKIGNIFEVNTYTYNYQTRPSVSSLSNSKFIVVWESVDQDGSMEGVFGQLFAANGNKVGNEFNVNTYTGNRQERPLVTSLCNSNFVVIWYSHFQPQCGRLSLFGQLFDGNATPIGNEFRVNTILNLPLYLPSVTSLNNCHFVVTWNNYSPNVSSVEIVGQLFDENATTIGNEFQVNTYTNNSQILFSVTSLNNGNFVVVWESEGQDGSKRGIYGQLFDGNAIPIGNEFQVNTYTNNNQDNPSVTRLNNGDFVVVWKSESQDGSQYGIYGQLFDGNATTIRNEFQVNTYTNNNQIRPSVTRLNNGDFVVVWESESQNGSQSGIYGQLFDGNAITIRNEFQVNTYTNNSQTLPSVTSLNDGNFIVIWMGECQGGLSGICGQLFGGNASTIGKEFQVNANKGIHGFPQVTSLNNGNFIVVWCVYDSDNSTFNIYGQIFNDLLIQNSSVSTTILPTSTTSTQASITISTPTSSSTPAIFTSFKASSPKRIRLVTIISLGVGGLICFCVSSLGFLLFRKRKSQTGFRFSGEQSGFIVTLDLLVPRDKSIRKDGLESWLHKV